MKGAPIDYSPNLIVDAFNSIVKYLGKEYLLRIKGRSFPMILRLIDLGLILKEIGPMDNPDKLLERLRKNDISAVAEARLIAHYTKHNLPVVIEPKVTFDGKERNPDFSVKCGNVWIYVEVTLPLPSNEQRKVENAISQVIDTANRVENQRKIRVFLYKLPTEKEIQRVKEISLNLAGKEEQPCTYEVKGIGTVVSEILNVEKEHSEGRNLLLAASDLDIPSRFGEIYDERPFFFSVRINIRGPPIRNVGRTHVYLPFTDVRAERIIHNEMAQLSPYEHNMIVLDISKIPAILRGSTTLNWINLIQRRLQPNLNRRIGGVLLIRPRFHTRSVLVEKKLVRHPDPYKRLPKKFLELTLKK